MNKYNIVLTGGPGGGKSTILQIINEKFNNEKTKVIVVPEVASDLYKRGVPILIDDRALDYQDVVYKCQKFNEFVSNYLADKLGYETTIIIYDRATQDNKAYLKEGEFNKILDKYDHTEEDNLNFYDLVIYLQSAANLENKYVTENNPARSESPEVAKQLDLKTLEVWSNHHNLVVVPAFDNFDDKINSVVEVINKFINEKKLNEEYLGKSKIKKLL